MKALTTAQIDVLKEMINIGVGKSAGSLNTLLNKHINLQVPIVRIMHYNELKEYLNEFKDENYASVTLSFKGDLVGNTKLLFTSSNAAKLVDNFTGENLMDIDLDSIRSGVLNEIGNIVINAVMGTFSNMLEINLDYIVPFFEEGNKTIIIPKELNENQSMIVFAKTDFLIDEIEVSGSFAIFFEMDSFKNLIDKINKFIG